MLQYSFLIHTLEALFLIFGITAVGFISSRSHLTGKESQQLLNGIAFNIATPALVFLIAAKASPETFVHPAHLAYALPILVIGLIAAVIFTSSKKMHRRERIFGISATFWMNANNLGLPLVIYALKIPELLIPLIFWQWLIVSPILHRLLEKNTPPKTGEIRRDVQKFNLLRSMVSPMTIAILFGITVSSIGWELPDYVFSPLEILSSAAVVLMLLAFGMSLGLRESVTESRRDYSFVIIVVGLKSLLMPLLAWLIGAFLLQLSAPLLFGVTLIAALPSAQSLNLVAQKYDTLVTPAKLTVIATTFCSLTVILLAAFLSENFAQGVM